MSAQITGSTTAELVDSIRVLHERGDLQAGELLPSVRALGAQLGVNRNTVVAAYRQLAALGVLESHGRGGTRVAQPAPTAQEGYAADTALRDVGSGNPDPALIPSPLPALARIAGRPVLYGEPTIDADLAAFGMSWLAPDLAPPDVRLSVTSGAVDAVERLLAQALTRDDAVGLEDPCFLSAIHTVRLGGYRPIPIPVDEEGMTIEGVRAALNAGVRAIIHTPRAQNPTGASLTATRAAALREVLAEHPFTLIVEDDHFSLLSQRPFHSLIGPDHRRFALIRSVSKFLGPDMSLALLATDTETADKLALRLSPGTTWVSHLLQRLTHAQLTDPAVREAIRVAGQHYARGNATFAALLNERGIPTLPSDGLSVWVDVGRDARGVSEGLMRRGWLARTGDEFDLRGSGSQHLRLTITDLSPADAVRLADDIRAAIRS